jgi:thiazole synthase
MTWQIANTVIKSRLILGTSQYPSPAIMKEAIHTSKTEIITASVRRQSPKTQSGKQFWDYLLETGCHLLPNTAGCRTAKEAITTAQMAREIFNTPWIKLEVIGNDYTLQPDPFDLVIAAKELVQQGFEVLPYCTDDLICCERLVDAGCKILMPWGSPIGSGQGLLNLYHLKILRNRLAAITLIIDAGIGAPSHAVQAMELGYDAILLNSAVSQAVDPIKMANAFASAIDAGRLAYEAGLMPKREFAKPSTPVMGTPFSIL